MEELIVGEKFTPDKLVECKKILELASDKKSSSLLYTIKEYSIEKKLNKCNIYYHNALDLEVKTITRNNYGQLSTSPQFITNFGNGIIDSICFLKNGQLYTIAMNGGESVQITQFELDIQHYKIFINDYNQIFMLCVMEVYPNKSIKETFEYDNNLNKINNYSSGIEFDKLMIRHWDNWGTYKKRNHLFLIPLKASEDGLLSLMTNNNNNVIITDLMFNWETDCPGKPFQGDEDFVISSDGLFCSFACRDCNENLTQKKDFAWITDVQIYMITLPIHVDEMLPEIFYKKNKIILNSYDDNYENKKKLITKNDFVYIRITPYGNNTSPLYSPNNKYLSFIHRARSQFESDKGQIVLYELSNNKLHLNFTKYIDLSFDTIEWCYDTKDVATEEELLNLKYSLQLIVQAQYHGTQRIFKLNGNIDEINNNININKIEIMNGDNNYSSPKYIPKQLLYAVKNSHGILEYTPEYLYFIESSLLSAPEIKIIELNNNDKELFSLFFEVNNNNNNNDEYCITKSCSNINNTYELTKIIKEGPINLTINKSHHIYSVCCISPEFSNNDIAMSDSIHKHYFLGGNNEYCQAWYLPPVGKDLTLNHNIPLLVIIHGGPQGAIMNAWHYRWNLGIFASQGYGVVAINFHGSTGYGQDYVDSITGDWGGKPYDDIMLGIKYILGQYNYLNPNKIGGLGASYGGYMINWINGHNDDKIFKCLVNHDGVFSQHSMYFTTEELFFSEFEFGLPWENEESYKKFSPSTYINKWDTPTLVIHGGKDYRVPETEGIATFTALQRRSIPSKFLYFPDENHWVLKPMNSIKWHNCIFDWLKQWLLNNN